MNLCGWGLGTLLLALFGLTSNFTCMLCISTAESLGVTSYSDLARASLGRSGQAYYSITMVLCCFIGNCAHIQTVTSLFGDMLIWFVDDKATLKGGEWHLEKYKQAILTMLLLAVALPYCFEKRITSLHWIGSATVFVVAINVSMFVCYCMYLSIGNEHVANDPVPPATWDVEGIFRAAGAICFAYTSLMGLFPVMSETSKPEQTPMAVRGSSVVCFIIYVAMALAGALTFGTATMSDCMYNILPEHRMAFRGPALALVACITLLYPVINFPMVIAVESLVGETRYSRMIISLVAALVLVCINMFVKDIVDLFGLCGSLGLGSIIYTIPCLSFLRTDPSPILSFRKVGALLTLLLGLSVTFVSTFFVLKHIASG
jgi:amino acid permease